MLRGIGGAVSAAGERVAPNRKTPLPRSGWFSSCPTPKYLRVWTLEKQSASFFLAPLAAFRPFLLSLKAAGTFEAFAVI